uniref:Uncharacterized protein n=1 Tax=Romanomermis culicivorax TaxID=13658 RepID=A0A915I126_ROMCU
MCREKHVQKPVSMIPKCGVRLCLFINPECNQPVFLSTKKVKPQKKEKIILDKKKIIFAVFHSKNIKMLMHKKASVPLPHYKRF